MVRLPRLYGLVPHGSVSEERFDSVPLVKPLLVTLRQPRNIEHFQKFWALAGNVANFHPTFLDADDAVRFAKRRLGMFTRFHEKDGSLSCEYESLSVESMDQLRFSEFYDRCLALWAEEIGADPEELGK